MSLLQNSNAISAGGYNLNQSLRFRNYSNSPYVTRIIGTPTNNKIFTYSAWVKRGSLGVVNARQAVIGASNSAGGIYFGLEFQSNDCLAVYDSNVSSANIVTSQVFRDVSAWYHIVFAVDTTQATAANRVKLYVNGSQVTAFSTANYPAQNSTPYMNTVSTSLSIGCYYPLISSAYSLSGYQTEMIFVDGQQLTPSSFGITDGATGQWSPLKYSGSYGNNGFYIPLDQTLTTSYGSVFSSTAKVLTVADNVNLRPGTGDLTVEFWVNHTSIAGSQVGYTKGWTGAGDILFYATSGLFRLNLAGAEVLVESTLTPSVNQWYHMALVRSGNNWSIYRNGQRTGLLTSYSYDANGTQAVSLGNALSTYPILGTLSNLRFIKGTALYTANFTPPTSPLTAVSGTQLLTLQNATIIDNSSNNFTITNVGSVTTTITQPFLANTLADGSGNNNGMLSSGIDYSNLGGAYNTYQSTYDIFPDVPTNTSLTVNNQCVLNVNEQYVSALSYDGNLSAASGSAVWLSSGATIRNLTSGKWYYQGTMTFIGTASYITMGFKLASVNVNMSAQDYSGADTNSWGILANSGSWFAYYNAAQTATGSYTATTSTIFTAAVDIDAGKIWVGFDGTWIGGGNPATGTTPTFTFTAGTSLQPIFGAYANVTNVNFGQRPSNNYSPPSGFKWINQYNLAEPTIKQGNKYMDATTFTATGTTQTITNAGGFSPDFLWIKPRSIVANHVLIDSVRGSSKYLSSDATAAEGTNAVYVTSLNSDGWTFGTGNYANGTTGVAWAWDAGQGTTSTNTAGTITSTVSVNASAGFSVVTFNSTSASGTSTIGHGLGVKPAMLIMKDRTAAYNWDVWTKGLGAITNSLILNQTAAVSTTRQPFTTTEPTSTVFSFNNTFYAASNDNIVVYCFSEIEGYSKFGSYVGTGAVEGAFVYTGFRPKFVLVKTKDAVNSWWIWDSARNTYNVMNNILSPDQASAELTPYPVDFLSNGFKLRTPNTALNSGTIIYAAFANNPFKYSNAY